MADLMMVPDVGGVLMFRRHWHTEAVINYAVNLLDCSKKPSHVKLPITVFEHRHRAHPHHRAVGTFKR